MQSPRTRRSRHLSWTHWFLSLPSWRELRDSMEPSEVGDAASTAMPELVGNASARISRLRNEKIICIVNKALLPLAKEEEPYLTQLRTCSGFGSDFVKRSKEFLDHSRHCDPPYQSRTESRRQESFFEVAHPSMWAGQKFGRGGTTSVGPTRNRPSARNYIKIM